jgi:hypothetical protein
MIKSGESLEKEWGREKAARLYRNWNALATVAFAGAALIAPPLIAFAGINAAQTAAGEGFRRHFNKKRRAKSQEQLQ